jgi:hypothetical protein
MRAHTHMHRLASCLCARTGNACVHACVCVCVCAHKRVCVRAHVQDHSVERLQSSTPRRTIISNYLTIMLQVFLFATVPNEHAVNAHAEFQLHSRPADPYTASPGDLCRAPVALHGAVGAPVWWEIVSLPDEAPPLWLSTPTALHRPRPCMTQYDWFCGWSGGVAQGGMRGNTHG